MLQKLFKVLLILVCIERTLFADMTPLKDRWEGELDPAIPDLASVLGYDFGEKITRHAQMEKYLEALARSSEKIRLQKIGESWEGRALYYVFISSPENLARLEEFRKANLRLSDPRTISAVGAEKIIDTNPVFVCLSYSVHGSEHSGSETALALAYYLLASNHVEVQQILQNTIVVLDPVQNPDGRERFAHYFDSTRGSHPRSDPNAAEHHQDWPGGRYNHYLFDMNRDWIAVTQKETRARIQAYRQLQPQIFADVHEMTEDSTYFFPPPSIPFNPNVPPSTIEWWTRLGKAIAADFDRHGIEYYTSERFDSWYPGYGDAWPTYNGAIAATFEQASVRGLVRKRYDDKLLHYQDAIWHHFLSSLATCKLASANREDLLRNYYGFRFSAVEEGRKGPIRQYLIRRTPDPALADRLVEKLLWQGVEVHQLGGSYNVSAQSYFGAKMEDTVFETGDYLISAAQPLQRLLQAVLEKNTEPDDTFLEAETQRRKDKEPSEFYDISAWSMPLAYGVDAYWSWDSPPAHARLLSEVPGDARTIPQARYAYILNYHSSNIPKAIWKLWQSNLRLYFSRKSFVINESRFAAGSVIIPVRDNPDSLPEVLAMISRECNVTFFAAATGWTEEGPDLGSDDVVFLKKPTVAVATDLPVQPTAYGAIHYVLEQIYELDFTPLPARLIRSANLEDYHVIILPGSGSDFDYNAILGEKGYAKLKGWVERGGTLIALQDAASYVIENGDMTRVRLIRKFLRDSAEVAPEKASDSENEGENETEPPDEIPGVIAEASLNQKHFLTFGYAFSEIPVFIYSSNVLEAPSDLKPVASYASADRLRISGLLWDLARERLDNKVYLSEETYGTGHVILFAENPVFRAYWEGLYKLFLNAIIFGHSL